MMEPFDSAQGERGGVRTGPRTERVPRYWKVAVPPRWTQTLAAAPEADTSVLDRAWAERDEGVMLSPERFDQRIARALASGAGLGELCLPDLYLVAACEAHDPAALRRFDGLLVALRPVAERFGVPGDEAIQQARVKLVVGEGRLSEYGGRSALTHWLKAPETPDLTD